jgi:predicted dinucleotide-binding enzyme
VDLAADVIDRIGYDPVRLYSLSAGRLLQPGGPVFGATLHRRDFESALCAGAA